MGHDGEAAGVMNETDGFAAEILNLGTQAACLS
jgi:hypothetical protein